MAVALFLADLALLLGLTLRLTRLVVADDLGLWFVRRPADRWARTDKIRNRLVGGLECPFCVGFWIGVLALLSLAVAGGPGEAEAWWRWIAGAFTLNEVAAHLGARLGDTADEE